MCISAKLLNSKGLVFPQNKDKKRKIAASLADVGICSCCSLDFKSVKPIRIIWANFHQILEFSFRKDLVPQNLLITWNKTFSWKTLEINQIFVQIDDKNVHYLSKKYP